MRTWYFPSWNGDFRLISVDKSTYRETASEKACVLEVIEPTDAEREMLLKFLEAAVAKNWTPIVKLSPEPRQEILLSTSVAEAGKVFITFAKMADRTITAIRSEGGVLVVQDTVELLATPESEPVLEGEVVATPAEEPKRKAKKETAVSVQRPTPSCPQCVLGAVSRASEVLLSFLTPAQHETWAKHRYIVVRGGITGHDYMLAHRHSPIAVKVGRICFDLDDEYVVHFHDNSVPPEEEVLAAKLILEHREPWLRNEATMLGFTGLGTGDQSNNPGGATDMAIKHSLMDDARAVGDVTRSDGKRMRGPRIKEIDDVTGELIGYTELPACTLYSGFGAAPPGVLDEVYIEPRPAPEMVFKNPFGDYMDGVPDAQITQQIGAGIQGAIAGLAAVNKLHGDA
jgi:hypothetical protein